MDNLDVNEQKLSATKIDRAARRRSGLLDELREADAELGRISQQISIYGVLDEVIVRLEQLHKLGAGKLFWGDKYTSEQAHIGHLEGLRRDAKSTTDKIEIVQNKKSQLEKEIEKIDYEIAYLKDQQAEQKEREEASKNEFVTNRIFEQPPFRPMVMPWYKKGEDEKRFRKYILLALLYCTLLGFLIPMWQLPVIERAELVKVPERFAQLLKKEEPKSEPKKEQEVKVAEKKPTEVEVKEVREKVAKTGILAFKNNFADLMDDDAVSKLGANAELSKLGSNSKSTARSLVTAQAQSGSGGIATSGLSRDVGGAGGKIGSVNFSRVDSAIGTATDERPLSDGLGPSRTDEEIQIVFDRYKAALYRIYNRELRKNPTLQGKVVLRLTIQPDGSVSHCKIESTDLASPELSAEIIERVKKFNFGEKDKVPALTILYPIDFLPAS